ncbi:MAG TPA: hypothetical protein ENH10_08535 [Bacteroidetes bacterium]|nr:hypothetical protein [Bacteroidota bacterium]HEX05182.1 hypothetical protein [Bacteroidota bacterium]
MSSSNKKYDPPIPGSVYIETYGCQMNLVDSEIVFSLLEEHGYRRVESADRAELVLVNTCAVREHAETKAISNIGHFGKLKEAGRHPASPETKILRPFGNPPSSSSSKPDIPVPTRANFFFTIMCMNQLRNETI